MPSLDYHNRVAGFDAIHEIMWISAADPAATPANDVQPFQWWMDTTAGTTLHSGATLKSRNAGNAAWDLRFDLAAIRGVASGLATLDSSGLIPTAQLPPLAITDVFVVASQAAMLALTAERGDVAIRTDVTKTFILSTNSPGTLADWKEVLVGSAAPSGTAGGDLGGSFPNPDVLQVHGNTFPAGVALGDLVYGSAANVISKLAGSIVAAKRWLRQTGTGAVSSAPVWDTITPADVAPTMTNDGNLGATPTIDWSDNVPHKGTLNAGATFTFSNGVAGGVYVLKLAQDATGSRTVIWPAAVHWSGGTAPTLTTTASKVDIFTFLYDGTTYYGVTSGLNYTA
jgi:hypothetical protein